MGTKILLIVVILHTFVFTQENKILTVSPIYFDETTFANLSIENTDTFSLTVFDRLGNLVCTVFDDMELIPGIYQFEIDGSQLSENSYFCILKGESSTKQNTAVMLKTTDPVKLNNPLLISPNSIENQTIHLNKELFGIVSITDQTGKLMLKSQINGNEIPFYEQGHGIHHLYFEAFFSDKIEHLSFLKIQ